MSLVIVYEIPELEEESTEDAPHMQTVVNAWCEGWYRSKLVRKVKERTNMVESFLLNLLNESEYISVKAQLMGIMQTCADEEKKYLHLKGCYDYQQRLINKLEEDVEARDNKIVKLKEECNLELAKQEREDAKAGEKYVVILEGKKLRPGERAEAWEEIIRNKAKRDNLGKPADIMFTRNNKVIIKSKTEKDAKELFNELSQDDEIRAKAEIQLTKQMDRKLILHNFPLDLTPDEIKHEIEDLDEVKGREICIIKIYKVRGRNSAIIGVDNTTRKLLLKKNKVCINFARISIRDYFTIVRCFRCQKFGHTITICENDVKCGNCGKDHFTRMCISNVPQCSNCDSNRDHRADSSDCPAFKEYKFQNRRKVNVF